MEMLKLPPMGSLLNARAGMDHCMPPAAPSSSLEYASMSSMSSMSSMNSMNSITTSMISQDQHNLFMSPTSRCSGRMQLSYHQQQQQQQPPPMSTSMYSMTTMHDPLPMVLYGGASSTPLLSTATVKPASPATPTTPAKMARFVVDNQETIAAKCKNGFGRMPRVATVDLPMVAPRASAEEVQMAGTVTTESCARAPEPARVSQRTIKRLERQERERQERIARMAQRDREAMQMQQDKTAQKASSLRSLRINKNKTTVKRRAQRASSSSSGSSTSHSSSNSANSANSSATSWSGSRTATATPSLDAITSYVAHKSEARHMPVLPGRTARHVSFNVSDNGVQSFTIQGHGTAQSYEIAGDGVIFEAVQGGHGDDDDNDDDDDDEERRWQSLVYGLGSRKCEPTSPQPHTKMLPSLAEVAQLSPPSPKAGDRLDLPPIRTAGWPAYAHAPRHHTLLTTLQPNPLPPALCCSSGRSPMLTRMSTRAADDDDAALEEHIRRLEAVIRSGGAKRREVEVRGGGADGPTPTTPTTPTTSTKTKTVVLIPPETAAQVGALLGVILREQYCRRREAQQEASSLPSISEVFGH